MDGLQYNYMGKTWRSCLTEVDSNCFFNSVFGTRNSEDQPYRDRYAKFRRMYWSTFLTYYSDGDLAGALLELLKNCFIANDRYQQKSIENVDNYTEYVRDITVSDYWVQVEEIPLLAALWNIRIILFIEDRDKPEVFDPNLEFLGEYPFRSINAVKEVVICLVDNHFSRLETYAQSKEVISAVSEVNFKQDQDSNKKKCKDTPSVARKKSYKKSGSAGIEGSLYQIDVLTMVLLNGIAKVEKWYLSTEDRDAGKFDDLIFEFLPSGSAILLQAKHKMNETNAVTCEDLVSTNFRKEFSLPKYFFSYQDILIRRKFKVQNIVICTNLDLHESAKKYLKKETLTAESVLHFHGTDNVFYSFEGSRLPLLEQNIKTYYESNVRKKEGMIITDEAIEDFLAHLMFLPNYLGEKCLNNAVEETVSRVPLSMNLDNKAIFKDIHKKMLDWFKDENGKYLTEVQAKAFFCDLRSNKYCEDLKLYDICFVNNNLPLVFQSQQRKGKKGNKNRQEQTENSAKNAKRISHIIPEKEYILNVIKIYQALQSKPKPRALFVDPDETIDIQRQIIDAFEIQHYTILVIVSNKTMEGNAVTDMCDKVTEILENYKYKRVILIAEKESSLARQFKKSNANDYEAIRGGITFFDLEKSTQDKFKKKKNINFQGKLMCLEELFKSSTAYDLTQTVTSEILVKLARDDLIEIGLELMCLDNYYIGRSFNRDDHNIPEGNMCHPDEIRKEKVVLISDSAGMGKTTVLTSLAIGIKKCNPHLWVVRLDLNDYTGDMRNNADVFSILRILQSQGQFKLKSEFDKKLFMNPERVVLMLDGVDEVSPKYTDLVIRVIKDSLAQSNLAKILVTTRYERLLCEKLELELRVRSITLKPFSPENQTDFLTNYWTEKLNLEDDAEKKKCEIYAKALVREMAKWINDEAGRMFAGIPLQTRMLAEVFQNKFSGQQLGNWAGCKEFLSTDLDEPILPKRMDLIQLYDIFIGKKQDIFINVKSNPGAGVAAEAALIDKFNEFHVYHRSIALEVIIPGSEEHFTCYRKLDHSSDFIKTFLSRAGIIQPQGETLQFIHRTFAEYYVAECILIEFKSQIENTSIYGPVVYEILSGNGYDVIRMCLDGFLKREHPYVKSKLYGCYDYIYYTPKASFMDFLMPIVFSGCAEILSCFIEYVKMTRVHYVQKYACLREIDYNNYIYCAIDIGELDIVQILLMNALGTDPLVPICVDEVLIWAAKQGHLEAIKIFVVVANTDLIFDVMLSARTGRSVPEKLSRFEDISVVNCRLMKALCTAALWGQLHVTKFLVELVYDDEKDSRGKMVLFAAFLGGYLDTVKFLVDRAHTRNAAFGRSLQDLACRLGNLNGVKCSSDDEYPTLLKRIADIDHLLIVKFIVEIVDVDEEDSIDDSELCPAILEKHLSVFKMMAEEVVIHAAVIHNEKSKLIASVLERVSLWAHSRATLRAVKFRVEIVDHDGNMKSPIDILEGHLDTVLEIPGVNIGAVLNKFTVAQEQ